MGCGTSRPQVKIYSAEFETIEVINLHKPMAHESSSDSDEAPAYRKNRNNIQIVYDEPDSPIKRNNKEDTSRNIAFVKLPAIVQAEKSFNPVSNFTRLDSDSDVDMSRSKLNNVRKVDAPVLTGKDIYNEELKKNIL